MIGPFRSHITMASFKTTIFTKLHLVLDFCVFTSQVMQYIRTNHGVFFLSRFLNLHRANDFLKQIELDDIVDNMKNFQELPQQSRRNKFVPICKPLLVNPATIAGEKGPFRQWLKKGPKQPQGENDQLWKWMKHSKIMMLLCMVTLFLLLTPFSFVKLLKKWLMSCNCIKKYWVGTR